MKKLIAFSLMLCSFVTLYSCGNDHNASHDTNQSVDTGIHESNNHTVMPPEVERPLLTIESVEEYTKILNTEKMPNDFVKYESISKLGAFRSLVFLSNTAGGDYSSYMYNLVDTTGYEIALYINHDVSNSPTVSADSMTSVDTSDMRHVAEKKSGTYVNQGLIYKYVSGELLSVSWTDHGISYRLCGSSMLSNYPSSDLTFVGKLLNKDDAVVAVNDVFNIEQKD